MNGSVEISTPISFLNKIEMVDGKTVRDYFLDNIAQDRPVVCLRNGEPLLRKDWSLVVTEQESVQFIILPQGNSAKKVVKAVAMLALYVAAPYAAAWLAPSLAAGSVGLSMLTGAIILGGAFLINAILPPPKMGDLGSGAADISSSPTYSITAQGNTARLFDPIPKLYGRHNLFPDFAAAPYAQFENNEQYLYQLFCLGLGRYTVDEIRIEDTKLWDRWNGLTDSFQDTRLEIIPPGGSVTLFPSAVITSVEVGGQDLPCLDDFRRIRIENNMVYMNRYDGDSADDNFDQVQIGDEISFTLDNLDRTIEMEGLFGSMTSLGLNVGDWVTITIDLIAINHRGSSDDGGGWTEVVDPPERKYTDIGTIVTVLNDYQTRFSYTFNSQNGGVYRIRVRKDGFNFHTVVVNKSSDGEWLQLRDSVGGNTGVFRPWVHTNSWIGPFTANPSDKNTNRLQVDLIYPRGLYYAADDGNLQNHGINHVIQIRLVDASGNPTTGWWDANIELWSDRTGTSIRRTINMDVSPGRYQVRMRRASGKPSSTRFGSDIQWAGLRAFIPDDNTYPDVTLLAVRIRATGQLTDAASRRFNTIQTSILPVYDRVSKTWHEEAQTNDVVWAAADILRNPIYGAGLPDSRIDMNALMTIGDILWSRGDKFNGVFDTRQTVWEALSKVLSSGRAQPVLIGGKVSFIRDQQESLVRGMFTPRNIIKNSLEISHIMAQDESPDSVIVEFVDERTWKKNEVHCYLSENSNENPARVQLFGVTNRTQAWREGMYQCAVNSYRRVFATLKTEMEGRLLLRSDPVMVSHDMVQWGQSSEAVDWSPSSRTMIIDEEITGTVEVISLSDRKGRMWGPVVASKIDNFHIVIDAASLASVEAEQGQIPVSLNLDEVPTRVMTGRNQAFGKRFKLVSSKPESNGVIQLLLTSDDPRVYSADTGSPPAETTGYGPGTIPNAPVMSSLIANLDPSSSANEAVINLSWASTAGANQFLIQYSTNGVSWRDVYRGNNTWCQIRVETGIIYLRGASIGALTGPFVSPPNNPITFGDVAMTPGSASPVTVNADMSAGVVAISWANAPRATQYKIEILTRDPLSEDFTLLEMSRTISGSSLLFTSTEVAAAGGPWGEFLTRITAQNTYGDGPAATYLTEDVTMPAPSLVYLVTNYDGRDANIQWVPVSAATSYLVEVYQDSSLKMSTVVTSTSIILTQSSLASLGGPWRSFEVTVKAQNGSLISAATTLLVEDLAPPAPSGITATNPDEGELQIVWTDLGLSDIVSYRVYISIDPLVPMVVENLRQDTLALGILATGLPPDTYYYRIVAVDRFPIDQGLNPSPIASIEVT